MDAVEQILEVFTSFAVNIARTIKFRDFIDIGLLSFAFYKVLWMLRTTSSGRILQGVLVLLIGLWLSSVLHLYAINFLLNTLVEWGLVVLVVLFQPEIRRFLERMGGSFLGINLFSQSEDIRSDVEQAIKQTVLACEDMSLTKTGALIVFERKDLLDKELETGITVNKYITKEGLKTIFENKAPLHDGAIIVRDGRILRATCILPLSSSSDLSRELGTRHRSGLGMSEQSDAIVVIVSEETGSVSVASNGQLSRHLTPERLLRRLENELISTPKSEKKTTSISGLFHKEKKGDVDL